MPNIRQIKKTKITGNESLTVSMGKELPRLHIGGKQLSNLPKGEFDESSTSSEKSDTKLDQSKNSMSKLAKSPSSRGKELVPLQPKAMSQEEEEKMWQENGIKLHEELNNTLEKINNYTPLGSSINLEFENSWGFVVPKVLFEIQFAIKPTIITKLLPDDDLHGGVTYYENLIKGKNALNKEKKSIDGSTLEDFHEWILTDEGKEKNPTMYKILNNFDSYKDDLGDDFRENYKHFKGLLEQKQPAQKKRTIQRNRTKK